MKKIDIVVPKMGMDTTEALVTTWLGGEGDKVEIGTLLVEFGTEKVNFAVENEAADQIAKIVQPAGAPVPVGDVLDVLDTG